MSNKKLTAMSILSKILEFLPTAIYVGFNVEDFYSTTPKGMTISAIFLMIAVAFFMKDSLKEYIKHPSAFTFVLVSWIFSLIFVVLGEKIFITSSILLASFLAALPLETYASCAKKNNKDTKVFAELKNILSGK